MRESLNMRLLFRYCAKKFYLILLVALVGAIILGGGYFLSRYVFAPASDYEAVSEIYLTYADDVRVETIYINDYTWSVLVDSDECVEEARRNLSVDVDSDYLKNAVTAGLGSDLRYLLITVTDKDPNRAVAIANAYETAVLKMTGKMSDIVDAQVFTSAKKAEIKQFEDRTLRMGLTGLIVGAFAGLALLLFFFSMDESVIIPAQTKEKFAVPTILCLGRNGKAVSGWEKDAAGVNLKELLQGKSKVFVSDISAETGCGKDEISEKVDMIKELSGNADAVFAAEGINQNPKAAEEMKEGDGVLLLLKADAKNGKLAERALDFLEIQKIPVLGFVLYNADSKWIMEYLSGK